jgi:hypothetical protein
MIDEPKNQQQHIRPKVRKPIITKKAKQDNDNDNDTVEETRQRMEAWMGVSDNVPTSTSAAASPLSTIELQEESKKPSPSSILKTPKYSQAASASASVAASSAEQVGSIDANPYTSSIITVDQEEDASEKEEFIKPEPYKPIVRNIIVERDPMRPLPAKSKLIPPSSHAAVEGYVPTRHQAPTKKTVTKQPAATKTASFVDTNSSKKDAPESSKADDEDEDVMVNSLADLMLAAGETLPSNEITPDTKMLEADLAFSVMSQEQFDEQAPERQAQEKLERQEQYRMFQGRVDVFGDGNHDEDYEEPQERGPEDDDDDDQDEDEFFDMLEQEHAAVDEGDEEDRPEAQPRAFILLWTALSEWSTPQAVEWLTKLNASKDPSNLITATEWTPHYDRSDVGSSRCAGLMAMLKMNVPTCLVQLQQPVNTRRVVEQRLGDWLRTLDYSLASPKLNLPLWKAMTCVLLDMVLVEARKTTPDNLPAVISAVGMTWDEYRYLTRSALLSLGNPNETTTTRSDQNKE